MASLQQKVQDALDEGRILVLGSEALVGFAYRSFFEPGFERMPAWARAMKVGSLSLLLLAVALIVLPTAYHLLVAEGEDRADVQRFATSVLELALVPIALGLGLDVAFAAQPVLGAGGAAAFGAAALGIALGAWYGFTYARRTASHAEPREDEMEHTELSQKIRHLLTETRTVLPGAQALLGFQLAVTLMEPFHELPWGLRLVHLGGLAFISVAVVLLVTPAAYHRIVEGGEETERFHRVGSRLLLAAMVALALGLCADLGVVLAKVLGPGPAALAGALGALAVFLGLWFGVTLLLRARRGRAARGRRPVEARS